MGIRQIYQAVKDYFRNNYNSGLTCGPAGTHPGPLETGALGKRPSADSHLEGKVKDSPKDLVK